MKFVNDPVKYPCFGPGLDCMVEVDTKPLSYVGVVAVDQSVYLLRDDKQITHENVSEIIGGIIVQKPRL